VAAAPAFGLGTAAAGSETEGTAFGVEGDEPDPGYAPVGPPDGVPPLGLGTAAWLSVGEATARAVAGDEPVPG
jgi:hypothetical protein